MCKLTPAQGRGDKTKRTVTGSFTFVQDDDKAKAGVTGESQGRGDKTKRTVTESFTFVQDDDKAKAGVTGDAGLRYKKASRMGGFLNSIEVDYLLFSIFMLPITFVLWRTPHISVLSFLFFLPKLASWT